MFGSKLSRVNQKEGGMGNGWVLVEKQLVEGRGRFGFRGPFSRSGCKWLFSFTSTLNACEDGTGSKFRNVGTESSDAGRLPKRHNTTFNTRRNFEIKILILFSRLQLYLPSVLFPSGFPTKTLYTFPFSPVLGTRPTKLTPPCFYHFHVIWCANQIQASYIVDRIHVRGQGWVPWYMVLNTRLP